jgi:hypothetical protein
VRPRVQNRAGARTESARAWLVGPGLGARELGGPCGLPDGILPHSSARPARSAHPCRCRFRGRCPPGKVRPRRVRGFARLLSSSPLFSIVLGIESGVLRATLPASKALTRQDGKGPDAKQRARRPEACETPDSMSKGIGNSGLDESHGPRTGGLDGPERADRRELRRRAPAATWIGPWSRTGAGPRPDRRRVGTRVQGWPMPPGRLVHRLFVSAPTGWEPRL